MTSAELDGGTVNSVTRDMTTGVITKKLRGGNGIARTVATRFAAEVYSLQQIASAPQYFGVKGDAVYMQSLRGERELDVAVSTVRESVSSSVFRTAGESLSQIHTQCKQPSKGEPVLVHHTQALKNIEKLAGRLTTKGIDPMKIIDYLENNVQRAKREVKRKGLSWTHGDFWLNNLMGDIGRSDFKLHGVIDWELARLDTPYVDFAVVHLSIERVHPGSGQQFWSGYGSTPDEKTKRYFAVMKTLEWIAADTHSDLTSGFYENKIGFIKQEICQ